LDVRFTNPRLRIALAIGLIALPGLATAAETFQFTVLGIDCKECAPPILKALNGIKGVENAKLDWKKGLATVDLPAGFEKVKIKTALDAIGYEAVFPGETQKDLQPLPPEVVERLDIVSYDGSRKVDVKGVLARGKVTVLDYWAEWCSPCKYQDARLQHLVMANPRVAVRRVDVGNWDNAAARQATAEFRLAALPYVRVYDAAGKHVGSVTGGSWDRLLELIEKAKARS
jgi:thiol-disulfide isomerase/thioredoxin/copper chaperone CopZ